MVSTTGIFSSNENNLFELLDLSSEDNQWETEDFGMPNMPLGTHLVGSCMVAIDDQSFILIGGQGQEDSGSNCDVGGELTQIYNLETGDWKRMPNLDPPRHEGHACMKSWCIVRVLSRSWSMFAAP